MKVSSEEVNLYQWKKLWRNLYLKDSQLARSDLVFLKYTLLLQNKSSQKLCSNNLIY